MKSKVSFLTVSVFALLLNLSAAERGFFKRNALPKEVSEAIVEALAGADGEYAAHAQYSAIIEKFGEVQPYTSIRMAETRHIAALERQIEKYGVDAPKNKFAGKVKAPDSLKEAATQGVASEERNIKMYDSMLGKVADYPDLVRVFTNLRRASENGHLPAFKAALENGGSTTTGAGACCGMCQDPDASCCCAVDQPVRERRRGQR